ncbi:DUF4349 domain-containing protein [Pseudogracilibacillus sp. SE30717A]|uniref:DUF4349 domain-containing protein n=1 Tax=Pseudogracilibacillus sp. SE30717A TaxID=3098293 RepID=UPI00300E0180
MRKMNLRLLIILSMLLFLAACSSGLDELSDEMKDAKSDSQMYSNTETEEADTEISNDFAAIELKDQSLENETKGADETKIDLAQTDRMIIHQAQLHINVKDIDKAQTNIEAKAKKYDGYIVESNIYRENEDDNTAYIKVRIPEKDFQAFLSDTEETAAEVLERNVTGQDVTEQFMDLESRLKSKRAVEERLLEFMKEAKKTEDLLQISNDLATIQEEIEVIVGQMKYLENQTSFSTIEISMYENSVKIPELENKDLDTWERTQKQLAISTNYILATLSGIVVFLVGNLPIILIFSVVGLAVYYIVKRKLRKWKDKRNGG